MTLCETCNLWHLWSVSVKTSVDPFRNKNAFPLAAKHLTTATKVKLDSLNTKTLRYKQPYPGTMRPIQNVTYNIISIRSSEGRRPHS